ncbi:hypothetical protein DB35_02255 [Streptomyces abyssalis]|uniref:ABM domain-containing protein n=1 Tax=Streptomyces abyssalis TaxID=933944 RepID=A0A1E7JPD9_9ACTN|nr:hypothetical protein [Streptomyces abyssalis]OEU90157.1 hypothetical protein AN215_11405 [Streptomyces abyssalis]OEU94890.1 hypothetical protein DB35_02255 [Streptomyces abyssalis]OEV30438.1 hypothetical protein AN219_10900 [Streptomyces nanshensis]
MEITSESSGGTAPVLMHNTMKITEGHLDGFREAVRRAVGFVEEHGPQLMVRVFVDEAGMRAHSFQLYDGSEAVRTHWKLSDPYIAAVMEHCSVERLDVYGDPDEQVRAALAPGSEGAFPVSITPFFTGFLRLEETGADAGTP